MSIMDVITGAMGGGMGQNIEAQVAGMVAQKMGIDPSMAQMAISALTQAHSAPTDTVDTAAQQTGMAPSMLNQILGHLGGEGALGSLASQMGGGQADQTGQGAQGGGLASELTGMLGGLMGSNKPPA